MGYESSLSGHNLAFLETLYEAYQVDPASVDPQWIPLFQELEARPELGVARASGSPAPAASRDAVPGQSKVDNLIEAYRLYGQWTATRIERGIDPGAESSVMKLHWSQLDIDIHETALDIAGATGELLGDSSAGLDGGRWMKDYLFGLANPIWGGTSEIQRNIVAERILGLPRK